LKPDILTVTAWAYLLSDINNYDSTPFAKGWNNTILGFGNNSPSNIFWRFKRVGELLVEHNVAGAVSLDTWHHVGYVYDGRYLTTILDGAQIEAYDFGSTVLPDWAAIDVLIGGNNFGGRNRSRVQDVRMYNQALSVAEVSRIAFGRA
jgi:hypothetical protein